jgi:hypothetical protein
VDGVTWLSMISGIVTLLAAVFTVWVWVQSRAKLREATRVMRSIHDVAVSVLWESQILPGEDSATRVAQLEKSLGMVSALRALSARYAEIQDAAAVTGLGAELGAIVQRGAILSNAMLTRYEKSEDVRHVWLISRDLEPDLSERDTGGLVKRNLAAGKTYAYFYPAETALASEQVRKLRRNVGADEGRIAKRVSCIPVSSDVAGEVFPAKGNIILFFKDDPSYGTRLVFEEVVLNKVERPGLFWQECEREHADRLLVTLQEQMRGGETY